MINFIIMRDYNKIDTQRLQKEIYIQVVKGGLAVEIEAPQWGSCRARGHERAIVTHSGYLFMDFLSLARSGSV